MPRQLHAYLHAHTKKSLIQASWSSCNFMECFMEWCLAWNSLRGHYLMHQGGFYSFWLLGDSSHCRTFQRHKTQVMNATRSRVESILTLYTATETEDLYFQFACISRNSVHQFPFISVAGYRKSSRIIRRNTIRNLVMFIYLIVLIVFFMHSDPIHTPTTWPKCIHC